MIIGKKKNIKNRRKRKWGRKDLGEISLSYSARPLRPSVTLVQCGGFIKTDFHSV